MKQTFLGRLLMNKQQGFTLIELLMVMVIIGLMVTIGIPNIVDTLKNNKLATSTNNFLAVLSYARGEAITQHDNRGVNITLIKSEERFAQAILWRDCTDTGATTDCPATGTNTAIRSTDDDGSYKVGSENTEAEIIRELQFDAPIFMTSANWAKIDASRILPSSSTAITAANTLNFGADGRLSSTHDSFEFWLCDEREYEPVSRIRLYRTGRVLVKKYYASDNATEYATCPN